jgi:AGCS family alanine or glycine:cation symporter
MSTVVAGAVVTLLVALVVIGGLKRIAMVSSIVVPFMAVFYVLVCAVLIGSNFSQVPQAIEMIFRGAFDPAAVGGGVLGTMIVAMQKGIARGIFSNEAGLGSAPIAAAAAKTKEPVQQGLICMTGTFIDTIIICTMTGLAIVSTGAWKPELGLKGVEITMYAFHGLPFGVKFAECLLMVALAFFAFTTILGWDYYSEKCLQYLVGNRKGWVYGYRCLYVLAVFVGPYLTVSAVWGVADIFNGLMAFPNLVALVLLSPVVARCTKDYFRRLKAGEVDEG